MDKEELFLWKFACSDTSRILRFGIFVPENEGEEEDPDKLVVCCTREAIAR